MRGKYFKHNLLNWVPLREQRWQISHVGPHGQCFGLCSPQGLGHEDPIPLPWPKGSRTQDGNERAWPCSIDTNIEPRMSHQVLFNHVRRTEHHSWSEGCTEEAVGGPGAKASPRPALDSGPGFPEPGKSAGVQWADFTAKSHTFQSPLKQT